MGKTHRILLRCVCTALTLLMLMQTGCSQEKSPDEEKIRPIDIEVEGMYKNRLKNMPSTKYGDPFIIRHDGYYYMYTTPAGKVMEVQRSEDLINWEMIGKITSDPVMDHAYAPEVVYYNGKFYLTASPSGNGHYIMSSDKPEGPFVRETNNFKMNIDGSFFIDDDGSWYFYNATGENIEAREMTSPTKVSPKVKLLGTSLKHWTEGPMVIKRGGIYYLTYTGNHFQSKGYRISYATSTEGPLGPYEVSYDNPVIISTKDDFSNLGHSSSFLGPDLDSWYIAYHDMYDLRLNARGVNIDRLSFNGKRMHVSGPTDFDQPRPSMPRFSTRGTSALNRNQWNDFSLYTSREKTGDVFTAEFNITKGFSSGVVLGYRDNNNFWYVVWSREDGFDIIEVENGNTHNRGSFTLPGSFSPDVLHCLRIASNGNEVEIYFDNMKRYSGILQVPAGSVGYLVKDGATIGYTAFSDFAFGSSDRHAVYNLPSAFAAANHAPATKGGASKSIDYEIEDTSRSVVFSRGSFISFVTNAGYEGLYRISLECSDKGTSDFEIEIYEDANIVGTFKSSDLHYPKQGEKGWKNILLGTINLKSGIHTLSFRLKSGSMVCRTIRVDTASVLNETMSVPLTEKSNILEYMPDNQYIKFTEQGLSTSLLDGKIITKVKDYTDFSAAVTVSGFSRMLSTDTTGLVIRMSQASVHEHQIKEAFFGYIACVGRNSITLIHNRYETQKTLGYYEFPTEKDEIRLEIRAVGSVISVHVDGEKVIEAEDPYPIPTGGAGIVFLGRSNRALRVTYKDFEIKPV